jgi:hypothetical protein
MTYPPTLPEQQHALTEPVLAPAPSRRRRALRWILAGASAVLLVLVSLVVVDRLTRPHLSPFRQYNEGLDHVIGYWPAEQPAGTTELLSTVPDTTADAFTGFTFGADHPPSSAPLMRVNDGAELGQSFAGPISATATAGWQLSWAARLGPLGGGERTIMYWKTGDTTAYGLDLNPAEGKMYLYSALGNPPAGLAYGQSYGTYDWTQWTLISIDASYSAGTTTLRTSWTNADNSQSGSISTSFAGVPASLRWWSVLGGAGEIPPGSTIGHVIGADVASSGGVDLFSPARRAAWASEPG